MANADLFGDDPAFQPGATRAPETLNPAQMKRIRTWAEDHVPWVTRGAFESFTSLDEYTDACLTYFRTKKTMRPNWADSVVNWIRNAERERLTRIARRGDQSAALALRDPKRWREQYDRAERATTRVSHDMTLLTPAASVAGKVVSLSSRRS